MNYQMIKMTWLRETRPRDWGPFFVVLTQRGRTGHYLVFLLGLFPFDKKIWGSRGCRIDTFFDVHRSRNVHSWFRLVPEPVLLSHRKRLRMSIVTRGVVSRKKNNVHKRCTNAVKKKVDVGSKIKQEHRAGRGHTHHQKKIPRNTDTWRGEKVLNMEITSAPPSQKCRSCAMTQSMIFYYHLLLLSTTICACPRHLAMMCTPNTH